MANKKHKKKPAPTAQAAAGQTSGAAKPGAGQGSAAQPEAPQIPRAAKWMGALCYLNLLILIPACTKWRQDDFVRFHLNQGLVLLACFTLCGAVSMAPYLSEVGFTLNLMVEVLSLVGLVQTLRGYKAPLPLISYITRNFHPF